MLFLGQINCAELQGIPGAEQLPSCGLLAFFGDHDSVMGCDIAGGGVSVFHWPDIGALTATKPPIEVLRELPPCALVFRTLIDLPEPSSHVVDGILTDREQVARYVEQRHAVRHRGIPAELHDYCGFGKLLGWPSLVQHEDLVSLRDTADRYRLLLQLDQYSNGDELEGWGSGGSLYVLIRDQDLRQSRFDRCEFEMQFT
jgi:uncharacterized protein YwqG